jgi:putative MATE family efflux protein
MRRNKAVSQIQRGERETRRKYKTLIPILATSIPAIIDLLCQPAVWMVDKILVGHIAGEGAISLAAVGTSTLITLFTLTILLTTLIGTIIIILRYIGAGEHEEASYYSAQSLLASLFIGIGIGLLWYLGAGRIFQLLQAPNDVKRLGVRYLQILSLFCPIIVTNFVATGLLRFSGDTLKSMCVNVTVVILNLFGDIILIFGLWGFPRMGVAGAALAAGIGNTVGFIMSVSFLFSGRATIKLSRRHFRDFRLSNFRRIIGKGIPVTTEQLIGTGAYLVVVRYSMRLGAVTAAAHQAIINFSWISTMFYLGVGTAVTALTGKSLGAKEEDVAERTGRVAWRVSICFGIVFGGVLFFLSRSIMRIFLPESAQNIQAIIIGARCLKIVAAVQIPKAINTVLSASLRAAGDVRWLVFVNIVGAGTGEVFLARTLGLGTMNMPGLGLPGIWLGIGIGEAIRSSMNYLRYRQGRWKKIVV